MRPVLYFLQCDSIKFDLDELKTSLLETAMLLEEREREIDVLQYQNKKLSKECDQLEKRNQHLQDNVTYYYPSKPHTFESSTNTPITRTAEKGCSVSFHTFCCDEKMVAYKDRVIQQKSSELEDVYAEYQLLLKENECLRKNHKLPPRDRKQLRRSRLIAEKVDSSTSTEQCLTHDVGTNTIRTSMPGLAVHQKCSEKEFEKIRNFLLAEVMSLQLLYSMFDLKTKSQLEKENKLDPDHLVGSSSISTTPSGYETGSEITVDERTQSKEKKTRTKTSKAKKFRLNKTYNLKDKSSSTSHIERAVPKTGNSIEEIIEAQRSGSYLLTNPSEIKDLAIETRVALLKKEICQQKKKMDEELSKVAIHQFGIVEPGKFCLNLLYS